MASFNRKSFPKPHVALACGELTLLHKINRDRRELLIVLKEFCLSRDAEFSSSNDNMLQILIGIADTLHRAGILFKYLFFEQIVVLSFISRQRYPEMLGGGINIVKDKPTLILVRYSAGMGEVLKFFEEFK